MATEATKELERKPILWTEPWYIDAHNNIRYTNLIPRLRLVESLPQVQKKRGKHRKLLRKLRKKIPIFRAIYQKMNKFKFQKLSLKFEVLLVTSDNLEQIDYFQGYVMVDDDDPVFTPEHIGYLNNPKVVAVVTTTNQLKQNLIKYGLKKDCFVIPSGVDLKKIKNVYAPPNKNKKTKIVCGYTLPIIYVDEDVKASKRPVHKERNISILLKIMDMVWQKNGDIELWLVGKPAKGIKRIAKTNPRIRLLGYVPHNEIFSIMKNFDIALYAKSLSMGGRHHIKLLEYMACGLPIVAINTEESFPVKEAKSGFVVSTIEEFAEAVLKLADNPDLRSQLGKNGLKYVKDFDWDVIAKRYERVVLIPTLQKLITNKFTHTC